MSFLQLVFSLDKMIEGNNSNVTLTRNSILENAKLTNITTLWMFERPGELQLNHSWLKFKTIY